MRRWTRNFLSRVKSGAGRQGGSSTLADARSVSSTLNSGRSNTSSRTSPSSRISSTNLRSSSARSANACSGRSAVGRHEHDSVLRTVMEESKRTAREDAQFRRIIEEVKAISLNEARQKASSLPSGPTAHRGRSSGSSRSRRANAAAQEAVRLDENEQVMIAKAISEADYVEEQREALEHLRKVFIRKGKQKAQE